MADNSAPTVRQKSSFIRFAYGFTIPSDQEAPPLQTVGAHVEAAGWKQQSLDKQHVLPHLGKQLNADEKDLRLEIGRWWSYGGEWPTRWQVVFRGGERRVALRADPPELLYLETGVGLLTFVMRVESSVLADWQDVLHHGRFFRLDAGSPGSSAAHGNDAFARRSVTIEPIGGGAGVTSSANRGFGPAISYLLKPLFGQHFEHCAVPGVLVPYSAFFLDGNGCSEAERFASLYRWRRLFESTNAVHASTHEDLNAPLELYSEDCWFSYSVDGGGFYSVDSPRNDFFDGWLTKSLAGPYYFGFAMAWHERLALLRFSEQIGLVVAEARRSADRAMPDRVALADLQDDHLNFIVRGRFSQVLRTQNHQRGYRSWVDALEVAELGSEVEQELTYLYERSVVDAQIADAKRQEKLAHGANLFAFGFGLPSLVFALLAVVYTEGYGLLWSVVILVAALIIGLALGRHLASRAVGDEIHDRSPTRS